MKTQNCRFIVVLFCAVTVLTITFAFPAKSWGQGVTPKVVSDTTVTVTPTLGPVVATQQFINDTTYALQNGLTSYGMFNAIASGSSINITNIFDFGNVGNAIYFTMSITSLTPFSLSQIGYLDESSLFSSFSGTMGSAGISYTGEGVGINGANIYTADNLNTPVYQAYIIGLNYSIDINGSTISDQLASWAPVCPFSDNVTYSLDTANGSATVSYDTINQVPEPSILSIATISVICLIQTLRKKIK